MYVGKGCVGYLVLIIITVILFCIKTAVGALKEKY